MDEASERKRAKDEELAGESQSWGEGPDASPSKSRPEDWPGLHVGKAIRDIRNAAGNQHQDGLEKAGLITQAAQTPARA